MLTHIDERLEVINDIPVAMLDQVEREMYKQKLRIEVAHFKQREQLYAAKREELLDLEQQYRKNQKRHVQTRDVNADKGETQTLVIQSFVDSIKEDDRKIDLAKSAMNDLDEKMDELKDNIRQRQQEINEMKRVIQDKANKGQML